MPTKVSARRQRCQKRMRLSKQRYVPEQNLVFDEVARIVRDFDERKAQKIRNKELAKQQEERLSLAKYRRSQEKNNFYRVNQWTGLRDQPDDDDVSGRNWMTHLCLKRKRSKFPSDVMFLINQFLNWIPAGCWLTTKTGCTGCGVKFLDSCRLGTSVCSWECYEIELRNRILRDYDAFITAAIELFNQPLYVFNVFDIDYMVNSYKYEYNPVLYESYEEIVNWHVYWNTPREYYEQLDYYDKWGICDYSDVSSQSSFFDRMDLEEEIKQVKFDQAIQEYNDDIWTNYRSHWTEWHTHVFYTK